MQGFFFSAGLTATVPSTPALTTTRAVVSIYKEVIVGLPRSVVACLAVLKQTAAWQGKQSDMINSCQRLEEATR